MARVATFCLIAMLVVASLSLLILSMWGGDKPDTAPVHHATGYDVTLSPAGTVHFDHVPKRTVIFDENYLDMLVAMRRERQLVGYARPQNTTTQFYPLIPGLKPEVDLDAVTPFYGQGIGRFDAEVLYQLNADVHHIDPVRLQQMEGWNPAIIERVSKDLGPFIANRYSRAHGYHGDKPYTYYTLWELSETIGEVYQDADRIRAIKAIYDDLVASIQSRLPPESERPTVGIVNYNGNLTFRVFRVNGPGFGTAEYRALGVIDALEPLSDLAYGESFGVVDLETMLALNPDILIHNWTLPREDGRRQMGQLLELKDHALGGRLTAIRTGRVYPGGTPMQGPIVHLFQLEMAAKQIYPERFGPFRDDHDYPAEEQLFDRQRLADAMGIGAPQ